MERSRKAFTLIEMLVVVLIIGILAAVALPQYQFAVLKAQTASVRAYLKAIQDAEELYYLTYGKYTTDFNDLDIKATCHPNWECDLSANNQIEARLKNKDGSCMINLIYSFQRRKVSSNYNGINYCYATTHPLGRRLCKSLATRPALTNTNNVIRYPIN